MAKRSKKELKTRILQIRVSEKERQGIKNEAKKHKKTVSKFIIERTIGK